MKEILIMNFLLYYFFNEKIKFFFKKNQISNPFLLNNTSPVKTDKNIFEEFTGVNNVQKKRKIEKV